MESLALINQYLEGAKSLGQAVSGLTPAQLHARPVPGSWSIAENVCHLSDTEGLFAERMKRVLAEDRPPLLFADPDGYVAALAYHERDVSEEVALVGLLRRQMAAILRAQPPEAWQRAGVHSKEGDRTLEQIVTKAITHIEHHLTFVREKRRMLESHV